MASILLTCIHPSHSLYETWLVRIRDNSYAKPNICIYRSHSFCMYETCLICTRHNLCVTWYVSIVCDMIRETCLIYIRHDLCATWNMCMHPFYSSYEAWLVCITRNSYATQNICIHPFNSFRKYERWLMCINVYQYVWMCIEQNLNATLRSASNLSTHSVCVRFNLCILDITHVRHEGSASILRMYPASMKHTPRMYQT